MTSIKISGNLGTEALEALVLALLKALNLDKNKDGKVSRSEVFQALSELAPQFFNFDEVTAEVRDLSTSEFQHLCNYASANMPNYPNVRAEAETVVSASLEVIGSAAKLVGAISRLNGIKKEADPAPLKAGAAKPLAGAAKTAPSQEDVDSKQQANALKAPHSQDPSQAPVKKTPDAAGVGDALLADQKK